MIDFIKKLTITVTVIMTICAVALGWVALPKKVKDVEEKTDKVDNKVEELADSVNDFVLEQKVYREGQDKREALMLELIRQK